MSPLRPFKFKDHSVRVITDSNNNAWFVAKDVALVLGYVDTAKAITTHSKKAKLLKDIGWANHPPYTKQQLDQQTKVIPESDVYRLVMRSKLESAELFQDWVVEEVIPSIRKTGGYSIQPSLPNFNNPIAAARAWADEAEAKQLAQAQIEADKPKIEFAMAVRRMDGCCAVGDFAKTIGTGQNKLFKRLRDERYLMVNNRPYQRFIDMGLFDVIEQTPYVDRDDKSHPAFKTVITGKGQVALEKKFREVVEAA